MSNKSQTPGSRFHKQKEEFHPPNSLIAVPKQENNMQETVGAGSESKSGSSESDSSSSSDDDSDSTPTKLSQSWFMQIDFSDGQPLNKSNDDKESKNKEDASASTEKDIEKLSVIDKSKDQTEDGLHSKATFAEEIEYVVTEQKISTENVESDLTTVEVGPEFLKKPKLRGPVHDDELDLAIRLIYL